MAAGNSLFCQFAAATASGTAAAGIAAASTSTVIAAAADAQEFRIRFSTASPSVSYCTPTGGRPDNINQFVLHNSNQVLFNLLLTKEKSTSICVQEVYQRRQ